MPAVPSVAGSGPGSGSSVRCQPSRICTCRSRLARLAQAGHLSSRVAPQGRSMTSVSPVSRSVRRSSTGRVQTPYSVASCLRASMARGRAMRAAREPGLAAVATVSAGVAGSGWARSSGHRRSAVEPGERAGRDRARARPAGRAARGRCRPGRRGRPARRPARAAVGVRMRPAGRGRAWSRARNASAGTADSSQPEGPGLADGELRGQGEGDGGGEHGDRVADGLAGAAAPADVECGGGGQQFADDGVGPAEPLPGAGRAVGEGPVFDVGERGGPGEPGDGEQDRDQGDAFQPAGAGAWSVVMRPSTSRRR